MTSRTRRQPQAGDRLGRRYTLTRRLGTGGMGEVWRARNETTSADVALKIVHASGDDLARARMRSEARLAAQLSHRNIVRVFDLLEEPGGDLVLVMELLRGETLARALARRGRFVSGEAVAVMVPILSALHHAHQAGIVHRDVTPANIFLATDPDGYVTPKLVDFGIAKLPNAAAPPSASDVIQTLPGSVLGTPRYMSPEQIRGSQELDGRADLFAVAAVTYEIITGTSPFQAPTPSASLASVLETTVDPDPAIEPRLWLEIARALSKRPYERHRTAEDLASAMCAAIGANESSLPALLRRDAPPTLEEAESSEGSSTVEELTSVEGQSLGPRAQASHRLRSRGLWVILALLGGSAGVWLWLLPHATPAASARPLSPAPSTSATSASSVPAAESALSTRTSDDNPPPAEPAAPTAPPAAPPKPAVRRAPRPAPPAAVAPVATTPGF